MAIPSGAAARSGPRMGGTMKRLGMIAGAVALVVGLACAGAPVAGAQSSSKDAPQATDIGVTPTEIKVAVVADVDNPLAPGLFKGIKDGAEAAAKYLNSKAGGGGLAGRKIVVDFIDSRLSATDSRNAIIQACQNDFVVVGTAALFLPTIDDAVNCVDKAGKVTGLPDYAGVSNVTEGCAPIAFPVNPPLTLCDTIDDPVQSYQGNNGAYQYLQSKNGKDLHGAMLFGGDLKSAAIQGQALIDAIVKAGIEADQDLGISARALQSAYTPIVQKMKDDGSNFGFTGSTASSAISLMKEAKLQGLDMTKTVFACTTACYDPSVLEAPEADGLYMPLGFLPFEEAKSNKMLNTFLKTVGPDNANGFAVYGWTSMLIFAEAVNKVVADQGVNGLTRANVIEASKTITDFDAGGMIAKINVADKIGSECTVLVQAKGGKFVRVWPKKKGTFACKPSYYVTMKGNSQADG